MPLLERGKTSTQSRPDPDLVESQSLENRLHLPIWITPSPVHAMPATRVRCKYRLNGSLGEAPMERHVGKRPTADIVMWGRVQPITRHMDRHCIVDLRISQASARRESGWRRRS